MVPCLGQTLQGGITRWYPMGCLQRAEAFMDPRDKRRIYAGVCQGLRFLRETFGVAHGALEHPDAILVDRRTDGTVTGIVNTNVELQNASDGMSDDLQWIYQRVQTLSPASFLVPPGTYEALLEHLTPAYEYEDVVPGLVYRRMFRDALNDRFASATQVRALVTRYGTLQDDADKTALRWFIHLVPRVE